MAQDVNLFDPDEAIEGGGGMIQAVSGATLTFEAVPFDYNGTLSVPSPVIHVNGKYADDEVGGAEFDEYYSIGDASKFRPKKDGTGFESLVEGARPTKTCKAMQLINSIVGANGGDKSIITSNIKDLNGINVDMERKPDVERPGLEKPKAGRTRTVFLVTSINYLSGYLPGQAPKKAGAKAAAKGKGKSGGLRQKAIEAVTKAIESAGGSLPLSDAPQVVFRLHKKDPDVKALTELASDEDFLAADDTPWGNDGETLTL